jgi:hypothetical protein
LDLSEAAMVALGPNAIVSGFIPVSYSMTSCNGGGSPVSVQTNSLRNSVNTMNPASPGGTCGNGSVGNGICQDSSLCCSKWGWCDNSAAHCGNKAIIG